MLFFRSRSFMIRGTRDRDLSKVQGQGETKDIPQQLVCLYLKTIVHRKRRCQLPFLRMFNAVIC